jgi:ethanolamine ammonia-lyase small subunit
MNNQYSDVIVHLSGTMAPEIYTEVQQAVAARHGVGRVSVSPRTDRLILVDYDPAAISSQSILRVVHGCGINAQLVGM